MFHRTFSECTLRLGQRTHISHAHSPRNWFHLAYCFGVIEGDSIPKNFWSGTYRAPAADSCSDYQATSSPVFAGLDDMEKVQQNNDPNWDSKQPKRNTTHNVLLKHTV